MAKVRAQLTAIPAILPPFNSSVPEGRKYGMIFAVLFPINKNCCLRYALRLP